jgi:hypothetical protein
MPRVRSKVRWVLAGVALCTAAVVVVSFLGRGRYQRRVVFPKSTPIATLAIREPLLRPDLTVMATLRDSGGKAAPVWMTVDSGATGVTLPGSVYSSLGLDALNGVHIRTEDPYGRVLVRDAGLVPTVVLDKLILSEVVTALGGNVTVLGQSVLTHSPWEVDWDRGTLTLGASPWPADEATVVLPLRREGDAEVVTIVVDGTPLDMVLDTGAFASTIPKDIGLAAKLALRSTPPIVFRSAAGEVVVRTLFSGDVRLGPIEVGRVEFASLATGGRRAAFGLLGLDVLSRFKMQVVPGSHLALRPRGDLKQTAAERIARWSFVPRGCEHAGCVQADLAPDGYDATLRVSFEADLRRPIDLLLGCEDDHGAKEVRTETRLAFDRLPREPKHVRVRLPSGSRDQPSRVTIVGGGAWFQKGSANCHALAALDLSPTSLLPGDAAMEAKGADTTSEQGGELQASLWP